MAATAPITFFTVLFVMFLVCSIRVAPNQRRLVTHEQVVENMKTDLAFSLTLLSKGMPWPNANGRVRGTKLQFSQ